MRQRDIRQIANITDVAAMHRILRMIASSSSRQINLTTLASTTEIPKTSLQRYLAILEQTFLIRHLPAWAGDATRRLGKAPKLFINDVGLATHQLGADTQRLRSDRNLLGTLVETFVVKEIRKQASWSITKPNLFFYRSHDGTEVDLLLEARSGERVLVEVKASATISANDVRSLRLLANDPTMQIRRGVLRYPSRRKHPRATVIEPVVLMRGLLQATNQRADAVSSKPRLTHALGTSPFELDESHCVYFDLWYTEWVRRRRTVQANPYDRMAIEALPVYQPALRLVDKILSNAALLQEDRPQLRAASGEAIDLPEPLFQILRQITHILAQGDGVSIVPVHKELTTQQAADILNVSRPYLISLLDQNQMPFNRTGKHRRITFGDLMTYKRKRDDERRAQLAELTQMSEEYGLYP